jgi:DNA-binding transcriptional MerR regulator
MLFKIGEFARIGQVTVRTLHYYEEMGLFDPREVEPFTGYRYYSLDQLPRLNRILALKDLGLSLGEIARMLDRDLSVEALRGILRLKQAELAAQVEDVQARLARVETRLRQIEEEGKMPEYEVILKDVPSMRVAIKYAVTPTDDTMGPVFQRLFGEVCGYVYGFGPGVNPSAPLDLLFYEDDVEKQTEMKIAVAVPFQGSLPPSGEIAIETLPGQMMASVIHHGDFAGFQKAYAAITGWIKANGYRIAGPSREVYLQFDPTRPADNITEIQFPVARP